MRIEQDIKLDFEDVMLRPKRSSLKSRAEVNLEREYSFKHSKLRWKGIPIIAANMDNIGTLKMAESLNSLKLMTAFSKFVPVDMINEYALDVFRKGNDCSNVFITSGIAVEEINTLNNILQMYDRCTASLNQFNICLDVANGYTEEFSNTVKRTREKYPNKMIMAGNVVTPEMTEQLILAGADVCKVGIGSGRLCSTRRVTGVGYPQLSAVIECADAAHGIGGLICSDGGCRTSGDVVKAFAAGADFCMLGYMFAGHDECNSNQFYGSSSEEAMLKHKGKVDDYRTAEGISLKVESKGSVENTVKEILGGLRSACTYVGASKLKDLSKCASFIRVK